MRNRTLAAFGGAVLLALALAGVASAHPLGNFTTNAYQEVVASGDRLYVVSILDLAEIPTFQSRPEIERLGRRGYGASLARRIGRGLVLQVDGSHRPLAELSRRLAFPRGAAGLRTTRLEVVFDAGGLGGGAHRLELRNGAFANRVGWREIVVRAERGAAIAASTVPAATRSDRLRAYPGNLLESPLDLRVATARVTPGAAPGAVPSPGDAPAAAAKRAHETGSDGFASLIEKRELSAGFVLLALGLAMFWGAAHALTPGHGKAVVAAYLVGTRGRARDALALGGIVTVTHTIGVFTLGLVTLGLSEFIVPEDLYPWLNLISAALVVAVGVAVLRQRVLAALEAGRGHDHGHRHPHGAHHHRHEGMTEEEHARAHLPERGSGARGLLAVGVSGGLLPCPTALVVLLAAISLHRVAFGLVLIVAFSLGLAAVISAIGLVAVGARHTFKRVSFEGRVVRALPAVSALLILVIGVAMTVRALPAVT
ncbi:MAG TPA: sulfite exporter TauE/SafE family protein [Gaiellaceae bacterium]|jgi:ABC-type nickel/cobalt efflux system permease component RcnA|nr:sulfite exporter TauE/SafE family protein [Gaiellaceae bacterium]